MSNFKGFSEDEIKKLTATSTSGGKVTIKPIDDEVLNSKRVLLKVTKGQKNAVIKNLTNLKTLQKSDDEASEIPDSARLSAFTQTKTSRKLVNKNESSNQKIESSASEIINYANENYDDKNTVASDISEIPLQSDGKFHPAKRKQLLDPDTDLKDPPARVISLQDESTNDKNISLNVSSEDTTGSSNNSSNCSSSNSLQTLQARQKLIEEQNRKRKEILARVLADKTKKTREETERLNEIQQEFKKLDALLSEDVNILRKQIEIASFDFMEAQKRYDKVEKEFLDAKFTLHQKQERKELLTEHLCTIIEKNEERKAQKLNELLDKLNVGTDEYQNKNTLQGEPT